MADTSSALTAPSAAQSSAGVTLPAKIAMTGMGLALVLLVVVLLWLRGVSATWLRIVLTACLHGCEGALVGGVCDVLAVRNVYRSARENFGGLVRGVSETVVRDFIGVRRQLESTAEFQQKLFSKENSERARDWLLGVVSSREMVHGQIKGLWDDSLRPRAVQWLLLADLRGHLLDVEAGDGGGLLAQKPVRRVIADCLDEVAKDEKLAQKMVDALQQLAATTTLEDLGLPTAPEKLNAILQASWKGQGQRILPG